MGLADRDYMKGRTKARQEADADAEQVRNTYYEPRQFRVNSEGDERAP